MTKLALYSASILSLLSLLAHIFIGGPRNATPLLSLPNLPDLPRLTMMFSWQSNSVLLGFITLGFAWVGYFGQSQQLTVFLTGLCGALGFWASVVAIRGGIAPWHFPPGILFISITTLGLVALIS